MGGLIPREETELTGYQQEYYVKELKMNKIPLVFRVLLQHMKPPFTLNETPFVLEAIHVGGGSASEFYMSHDEVLSQCIASIRDSVKKQMSTLLMNSNILG